MYGMQLVVLMLILTKKKKKKNPIEPYLSQLGGGIFVLGPPSNHKATQARPFIIATPKR